MTKPSQIDPAKGCVIQGVKGTARYEILLSMGYEFLGGDLVRIADREKYSVKGADKLSATYTPTNWNSGVASGAYYAFRTLTIPRQEVIVREFTGRLYSANMDAVANGVALAVAKLSDRELPALEMDGWTIDCQIATLRPSLPASQATVENKASMAAPLKQTA